MAAIQQRAVGTRAELGVEHSTEQRRAADLEGPVGDRTCNR